MQSLKALLDSSHRESARYTSAMPLRTPATDLASCSSRKTASAAENELGRLGELALVPVGVAEVPRGHGPAVPVARAAETSADPVTIAASARIITHTLMAGGHLGAAITMASTQAERLDRDVPAQTPTRCWSTGHCCCAVPSPLPSTTTATPPTSYSARPTRPGAVSASTATFGGPPSARPTPSSTASASPSCSATPEPPSTWPARSTSARSRSLSGRRTSWSTPPAHTSSGAKHDKAYIALRAAEETAHEEVGGRPRVQKFIRDLMTSAPPSMRREVEEFAAQAGVPR